jgi:ribA/ribD-fused uncharacterized protein
MIIDRFEGRWRFLSNFHPCEVEHQGIIYKSVEHYYIAMKCNNEQMFYGRHYTIGDFREMIANTVSAAVVKSIGQKMKVRKDWDEKKLDFMLYGIREKFKDPELRELLLSTEDASLVEGNNWNDKFWGVSQGKGLNHLGRILMKVRKEILDEISAPTIDERPKSLDQFFKQTGQIR